MVYSNNGNMTYGTQVGTMQPNTVQGTNAQGSPAPQPYSTGYQPQGTYDVNGNLINNANQNTGNPNAANAAPSTSNSGNTSDNNNATSGKVDDQPNSNAAGSAPAPKPGGQAPAPNPDK